MIGDAAMNESTPAGEENGEEKAAKSPLQSYVSSSSSVTGSQNNEMTNKEDEQTSQDVPTKRDTINLIRSNSNDSEPIPPFQPVHQFVSHPQNIYDSDASNGRCGSRRANVIFDSRFHIPLIEKEGLSKP